MSSWANDVDRSIRDELESTAAAAFRQRRQPQGEPDQVALIAQSSTQEAANGPAPWEPHDLPH